MRIFFLITFLLTSWSALLQARNQDTRIWSNPAGSLAGLKKRSEMMDSVNSAELQMLRRELDATYDKFDIEDRTERLKAKRQTLIYILIGVTLLIAIFIGIVFSVYWHIRYRDVSEVDYTGKENDRLLCEIEHKSSSERKLRDEIRTKAKELTTISLYLIQKNEVLSEVKDVISDVPAKIDQNIISRLTKLSSRITMAINTEKNWEYFRLYFEKVNSDFFLALANTFPNLNNNDLKLCALLKLNLETKEIADIMEISPESAKVAKHRLRKKVGISPDADLQSFFEKFDPASTANVSSENIPNENEKQLAIL